MQLRTSLAGPTGPSDRFWSAPVLGFWPTGGPTLSLPGCECARLTNETAIHTTVESAEEVSLSSRRWRGGLGRGASFFSCLACASAVGFPSPQPSPRSLLMGRGSCYLSCGRLSIGAWCLSILWCLELGFWCLLVARPANAKTPPVPYTNSLGMKMLSIS